MFIKIGKAMGARRMKVGNSTGYENIKYRCSLPAVQVKYELTIIEDCVFNKPHTYYNLNHL